MQNNGFASWPAYQRIAILCLLIAGLTYGTIAFLERLPRTEVKAEPKPMRMVDQHVIRGNDASIISIFKFETEAGPVFVVHHPASGHVAVSR